MKKVNNSNAMRINVQQFLLTVVVILLLQTVRAIEAQGSLTLVGSY
jgi:hypothetical protein